MSEYLDQLDQEGRLTGNVILRSEAHAKGLWHGTVHIYTYCIVGDSLRLLVHLRALHKDVFPNRWDPVFGGHIKAGATPVQAATDELHEEVGFNLSPADLRQGPIHKADKGHDREFNHLFAYRYVEKTQIVFNDNEVQCVNWIDLEDIISDLQIRPEVWRPTLDDFMLACDWLKSAV